jgi:hypothetical protein
MFHAIARRARSALPAVATLLLALAGLGATAPGSR